MTRKFREEMVDFITNRLYDYEGNEIYISDLASTLTEDENATGAYIIGFYKCLKYIAENIQDASETFDYMKNDLDWVVNPFDEPEKFVFMMLYWGVEEVLNEADLYSEFDDEDKITLDEDTIQTIISKIQ